MSTERVAATILLVGSVLFLTAAFLPVSQVFTNLSLAHFGQLEGHRIEAIESFRQFLESWSAPKFARELGQRPRQDVLS
jgi:hypothetical protein